MAGAREQVAHRQQRDGRRAQLHRRAGAGCQRAERGRAAGTERRPRVGAAEGDRLGRRPLLLLACLLMLTRRLHGCLRRRGLR